MKCSSFSPQHLSSRQSVQQSTSQVSGSPASGEAPGEDAPGSSLVRCSSSQEPACEQTVQAPLLCALHAAQLQERRLRGWGDQSARKPKCHLGWSLLPPPRVSQCIRIRAGSPGNDRGMVPWRAEMCGTRGRLRSRVSRNSRSPVAGTLLASPSCVFASRRPSVLTRRPPAENTPPGPLSAGS